MNLKNKNVLVTGGAGFIPSHIVDMLVKEGANVTAIDNLKDGRLNNLELSQGKVKFIKADVRDTEEIKRIVKDQEIVFHLAANANVPMSVKDPEYDFQTNVIGTFNILKGCLDSEVKRIVFASSAAVYGEPQSTPVSEKHPLNPISPYGASKLAAEKLGFAYYKTYGLPFTIIRVFNTYGPRMRQYVMFDLLCKLKKNQDKLEVLGTGEQIRDYSYISDTVKAFLLAAKSNAAIGEVFNISGGRATSIKELVGLLIKNLNLKTEVYYTGKSWKGDIQVLLADISKTKEILGFEREVELEEGVKRYVEWFQNEYKG